MCLQRVVDGDLLDVDVPGQVRAAGAILACLHDTLAVYPDAGRVAALVGTPEPLRERITAWLNFAPKHLPAAALERLQGLLADAASAPLQAQLVHGDFRASNVLCLNGHIAAVLDFEEVRVDQPIVELARSAVMLGTRFRNWGPVSAEVRAEFLSGYRSVHPLTADETHWWDLLVLWQGLALIPSGEDPTGWGPSVRSHLASLAR
ncbi:MAG: phosphotransferase [Mycobacteriales bacterium]